MMIVLKKHSLFIALFFLLNVILFGMAAAPGCGSGDSDSGGDDAGDDDSTSFALTSAKFGPGDDIPALYSCDNADYDNGVSPPLSWANPPADTVFFALTLYDPDASDTPHWGVFDIPPEESGLADGLRPDNALPGNAWEALNYTGAAGYAGPCPPTGETHNYVFTIYALNASMPDFDQTPTIPDMQDLIEERLIGSATLTAKFGH